MPQCRLEKESPSVENGWALSYSIHLGDPRLPDPKVLDPNTATSGLHDSFERSLNYFLGGSGILAGGATPAGGGGIVPCISGVEPQQPHELTA